MKLCHFLLRPFVPKMTHYPRTITPPLSLADADEDNEWSQILNFIEEQARRKIKENLRRKSHQQKPLLDDDFDQSNKQEEIEDAVNRIFTFKMPEIKDAPPAAVDRPFQFGVAPNDPRFYDESRKNLDQFEREQLEQEQEESRYSNNMDMGLERSSEERPYMRIKGPLVVNPKPNPDSFYKAKEMQGLLHKWGRNNNLVPGMALSGAQTLSHGQEVVQRPVNVEQTSVSIYAVALIAGVSAAITIGLIALGVGWWT